MSTEDQSSLPNCHDEMQKFILLKDHVGAVVTKKYFGLGVVVNKMTRSNSFNALTGGLFKCVPGQDKIEGSEFITIVSVDNDEHYVENCSLKDLRLLSEEQYKILLAIPSCQERSDAITCNDGKSKLEGALQAKTDCVVEVYDEKGEEKIGIGILKDIGPTKGKTKKGTYYHVLLESVGVGGHPIHTSEGQRGKHDTMVVPLNRIRFLLEDSKENKRKGIQSNVNIHAHNQKQQKVKEKNENSVQNKDSEITNKGREKMQNRNVNDMPKQTFSSTLKKNKGKQKKKDTTPEIPVGTRVVYFPEGKIEPIRGVVRFFGTVLDEGVFAGVELDVSDKGHKYVLGNYYKGQHKLFDCEHARGLIVKPHELFKEEYTTDKVDGKRTYVTVTNSENGSGHDLEKKEVKIPEVKTMDTFVKEQEELLRKIEKKQYASMDASYSQNRPTSQVERKDREHDIHMHDQEIQRIKNEMGIKMPPTNKAVVANGNHINSHPGVNNVNVEALPSIPVNLNKPSDMFKRNEEGRSSTHSVDNKELSNEQLALQVGDMVEIMIKKKLYYGVLKWKGTHERTPDLMAGLELESDEIKTVCTTGTFLGKKYFASPLGRAFFTKLQHCKPDSRFASKDVKVNEVKQICKTNMFIKGSLLPNTRLEKGFVGVKRGIQGHYNSCYMDSTLFAMFAYSHVFDVILNRKKRKNDIDNYDIVKDILKEQIVNPLRVYGYVNHESVFELRKHLNGFANIGGFMNEEKDPEEFVVLLFEKVLKVDPFIKLHVRGANNLEQVSHLYQIFPPKDEQNPLPSVQYLLETSFLASNLQLADIPSVMILQMPRFGQEKMYQRVQITSKLDITPLLFCRPQKCVICGHVANVLCEDCACQFGGWEVVHTYFCESCCQLVHQHPKRVSHQILKLPEVGDSINTSNHVLELFAVVCIELSHYVAFVKCGEGEDENWVFFDSMADRVGEENGYNIPQVIEINNLKHFLNGNPLAISELDKDNGHVTRVFNDSSLCFYRNKSLTMYR